MSTLFKRIIAASLFAALISSSAFASRARQVVLGTADPFGVIPHGSFYYDDNLNVFFNPSYANDFKNWASIEKTNGGGSAEGGFVAGAMGYSLGFYMNRADAVTSGPFNPNPGLATGTALIGYPTIAPVRPVDLIFAGDFGVKFGLGLTYASNRRGTDIESTDATLRAGAQVGDLEPFASFKLKGSEKLSSTIETKNTNFTVGTRYKMADFVPFAAWRYDKLTSVGGTETKSNVFGLGVGRSAKLSDMAHLHYSVAYWRNSLSNQNLVPIDLAVEADATTWLALRAGLNYRLWDRVGNVSTADTTTGRLGATVKVGKASLDWAVGGVGGLGGVDSQAFSFGEGLFSVASLNYSW